MKPITIISALAAVFFASLSYAKCDAGSKTVFSCMTAKGKQIEVCDAGKNIIYSFGKLQVKPEIVVSVPRQQASTSQWSGMGAMSYAVDIPNGNAVYSVFWSADRSSDDHPVDAGVNVIIKGELAATVNCAGENIEQNIEGIDLKPTE